VTSSTTGTHTNPAITLTFSPTGNAMSAPVDLIVVASAPGFSKAFSPTSVPLGGKSTLTFTIDNGANTSRVANLDFTDILPTGMVIAGPNNAATTCVSVGSPGTTITAVSGTSVITLDANGINIAGFEVLPPKATCTVTVDVTATGVGMLNNVSGDLLADFVAVGKATAALTVTASPVSLAKSFTNDPVPPGGTVGLRFTISNLDRTFPATAIGFTDALPAGLSATSTPASVCGGTVSGTTTLTFTGGTVADEGSCVFTVTLAVPGGATPGTFTNTTSAIGATVNGSMPTGNMATDTVVIQPIPTLTKSFTNDPVAAGGTVTLSFTITNTSLTSAATDIAFTDMFPIVLPTSPTVPADGACGAGSDFTFTPLFNPPPPSDAVLATLTLTEGVLAASDSCTFEITLDVLATAAAGTYVNTTSAITATVDGTTLTGGPATDNLAVISAPMLVKEFLNDPVVPGGTVNLAFTLTHDGNSPTDATGIMFTDDLAAALTGLAVTGALPTDPCGAGSTLTGTSLLTLTGGTLAPGGACTFSVTLNVPAGAAAGSHTNTTSAVISTVGGTSITGPTATDDLQVQALTLTKAFLTDPVIPGGTTTLRFTITNAATGGDATSISFFDSLTATLSGLAATGGVSVNTCGGSLVGTTFLIYSLGSLSSGQTCTIEVPVLVPLAAATGSYINTTTDPSFSVGGSVVTSSPATDTLMVGGTLLSLTKEFTDDPVAPGGTVNLRFTLTNLDTGNAASDIDFTDNLGTVLSGLTATGVTGNTCSAMVGGTGTPTLTVNDAALAAGATCTIDVSVEVPAGAALATYTNTTSALTGTIGGLGVTGAAASGDLTVSMDLQFTKAFDAPTFPGGTPKLTFTLTNTRSTVESDLTFVDNLDNVLPGLTATNLPLSNVCGTGSMLFVQPGTSTVVLTGGSLPATTGSCMFEVDLRVPGTANLGTFPNTSSQLLQSGLALAPAATASLVVDRPDIRVTKTDGVTSAVPGQSTITYTVVVTNVGSLSNGAVAFADTFPASLTCSWTSVTAGGATGSSSTAGGAISDTLVMPVGSSATYTVTCSIAPDATGTLSNTATATPSVTDKNPADNSAADNDTVLAPTADVAVAKTDGLTSAVPGQSLTYTIVASNAGPSDDPAATLTDTFPAGLTCSYTSVAAGGASGNTAAGSGNLSETLSLPSGSSVTYTVSCTIDSTATGTFSNTATISGSVTDPAAGNNNATDGDTVLAPTADVSVTKTDGVTSAVPGASVTYTIVVANTGLSSDPMVAVADTFPAVLTCSWTSMTAGGATGSSSASGAAISDTLVMPAGSSATYTVTCAIDHDATGTLSNTATATASVTDGTPGNNSATDADTALAAANLSLTKEFTDDPVAPGSTVTLMFTLTNLDVSLGVTGLTFSDDLDGVLSGLAAVGLPKSDLCGTGSMLDGTKEITLTGGSLEESGACTFDVTLQVPAGASSGIHVNTTSALIGTAVGARAAGDVVGGVPAVANLLATSFQFTDDPIVPGVTPIKAIHFTELQGLIDALRGVNGLPPYAWNTLVAGVTDVQAVHLANLRIAVNQVLVAAGSPAESWETDAANIQSLTIRADDLTEVRTVLKMQAP